MSLHESTVPGGSSRVADWPMVWNNARERLRRDMGDAVFDAWIRPLSFVSAEGADVKLGAFTPFARNWVASHHLQRIERALSGESGAAVTVELVIVEQCVTMPAGAPASTVPVAHFEDGKETAGGNGLSQKVLNPSQTLGAFIAGPRHFAHLAAGQIAAEEGDHSLLYIHGGFGFGKSHLLNGIALEAGRRGRKALYLGAEDFMRQFLGALNRRDTLAFKQALRDAHMLLIDDLQHLCRSPYTVAELLHTVNAFSDQRRKLVIASDRAPEALEKVADDVRTRLKGGLVVGIEAPDQDTRLAILKSRAEELARAGRMTVPTDVIEHIAGDLNYGSPREFIGAFHKAATYADLTKQPLTLASARHILGQASAAAKKVSIEYIQRKTAEFYKLELRDFQSPQRSRRVARPRQVAMFLARELTMRSLPEIGKRFGGRDHTTVLHACRRVTALCDDDPTFNLEVDFIRQVLQRGSPALLAAE